MASRVRVDLFCEDLGHEQFCRALISRLARQEGVGLSLSVQSGRGGAGRALQELKAWQRAARKLAPEGPDLLVVVLDANCEGWNAARNAVAKTVDASIFPRSVVGCPDPHIERWCIADPPTFRTVVGGDAPADPGKCEKNLYKRLLREAIERAGQVVLGDGMEFAPDLVEAMDLYRAARAQQSLRNFVDELTGALRGIPR